MNTIIRLENLALGLAALICFHYLSGDWWLFALLILAPDLAMLGYLINSKIGAICYNLAHTWIALVLTLAIWSLANVELALPIALIWAAHIGLDRAIGYGLKHYSDFKDTHLG